MTVDPSVAGVLTAEAYATDLGFTGAAPDVRLPIAEQFVKGLFFGWAAKVGIATAESAPRRDPSRWRPKRHHRAWEWRVPVQLGIGPLLTCPCSPLQLRFPCPMLQRGCSYVVGSWRPHR